MKAPNVSTGRKHYRQMNPAEMQAIEMAVRAIAARRAFVDHAEERMQQKKVSAKEIEICLRYGSAIEIHNEAGELRAVIQHTFGKPAVRVSVVIALATGKVVTTWKNSVLDNHSTVDLSKYTWRVNVVSILKEA